MKYLYPKLFLVCLAVAVYYNNRPSQRKKAKTSLSKNDFTLVVQRGAFHEDYFEMTKHKIKFMPDTIVNHKGTTYYEPSETFLDSLTTIGLIKKIEAGGFWQLKNRYPTASSCTSQLIVTLKSNGKSKTVICDDFEHGCPDLIKYIDKKVVEFEGNKLKRIDLPG